MWIRLLRTKTRRTLRRIVHQPDSATRIARGVSGGFFAAAFPLPGLQIPLSLLFAWILRGNKLVSVFPQFISNAGTMLPLAVLQFHVGKWFWPAHVTNAATGIQTVLNAWSWRNPAESGGRLANALAGLGASTLIPLSIGVLLTGLAMAIMSYPVTAITVLTWRAQRRKRRLARGFQPHVPPRFVLPSQTKPAMSHQDILARYVRLPQLCMRAESAELLVNGRQAFPKMLDAIDAATATVDMETYILCDDATGRKFHAALIRASRRGVHVRLLYDWVGCMYLPRTFVQEMLDAGVHVAVYHPLVLTRPSWAINRRDHRKILVVDAQLAFMGGLNISDDYAAPEDGGKDWRDTHVRLAGRQMVLKLTRLFHYGWRHGTPFADTSTRSARLRSGFHRQWQRFRDLSPRPHAPAEAADAPTLPGLPVQIIGNEEFSNRRTIRKAYLYAISRAQRYILIENAYFIPDRAMRRALTRAAKRGVVVAVAVARYSDIAVVAHASRSIYSELLAGGVRLFEWPREMLHAKTAVIDDAWSLVGSYNLDHRSLIHQLEVVAVIADADFARRLRDQTLADLAQCHQVTLEEHESRPLRQILLESAAYFMRSWL